MTRTAALRFGLAGIVLALAAWLGLRSRDIDEAQANDVAKVAAVRYAAVTGQPVAHFGRARRVQWPDGWEYTWTYRPCPDAAALRVFVPRRGARPRITQHPDCDRGLGVAPRET